MQRQGWQLVEQRYDDIGRSSETLDRPALNRLIVDIQAGNIDRVLVHRLDRIARKILYPQCSRIVTTLGKSNMGTHG
jgi:DNA invertase Pin-like site-specific DNA recombinase